MDNMFSYLWRGLFYRILGYCDALHRAIGWNLEWQQEQHFWLSLSFSLTSMVDRGSISKMSKTITKTKIRVAKMVSMCTIESISLGTRKGCRASLQIKCEF